MRIKKIILSIMLIAFSGCFSDDPDSDLNNNVEIETSRGNSRNGKKGCDGRNDNESGGGRTSEITDQNKPTATNISNSNDVADVIQERQPRSNPNNNINSSRMSNNVENVSNNNVNTDTDTNTNTNTNTYTNTDTNTNTNTNTNISTNTTNNRRDSINTTETSSMSSNIFIPSDDQKEIEQNSAEVTQGCITDTSDIHRNLATNTTTNAASARLDNRDNNNLATNATTNAANTHRSRSRNRNRSRNRSRNNNNNDLVANNATNVRSVQSNRSTHADTNIPTNSNSINSRRNNQSNNSPSILDEKNAASHHNNTSNQGSNLDNSTSLPEEQNRNNTSNTQETQQISSQNQNTGLIHDQKDNKTIHPCLYIPPESKDSVVASWYFNNYSSLTKEQKKLFLNVINQFFSDLLYEMYIKKKDAPTDYCKSLLCLYSLFSASNNKELISSIEELPIKINDEEKALKAFSITLNKGKANSQKIRFDFQLSKGGIKESLFYTYIINPIKSIVSSLVKSITNSNWIEFTKMVSVGTFFYTLVGLSPYALHTLFYLSNWAFWTFGILSNQTFFLKLAVAVICSPFIIWSVCFKSKIINIILVLAFFLTGLVFSG